MRATGLLLFLCGFCTAASHQVLFDQPVEYAARSGASGVDVRDLDGDGFLDLAIAGQGAVPTNEIAVLLNRGDGSFESSRMIVAGLEPAAVAGGDFDGDGDQDLVVAARTEDKAFVLLNVDNRRFADPFPLPVGEGPNDVVTADFNSDGILDFATANERGNTVRVAIGRGDGTFYFAPLLHVGRRPLALVTADFDGDDRQDLAVAVKRDGLVRVFYGNGGGGFPNNVAVGVGGPIDLAAADLDEDGLDDLVVTRQTTTLAVVLARPGRAFDPPSFREERAMNAETADLDLDGHVDIAVVGDGLLQILRGDGAGGFSPVAAAYELGVHGSDESIDTCVADLDSDGYLDIVTTCSVLSGHVSVALANSRVRLRGPR